MAKSWNDTAGAAKKGGEYYKWVDGEQTLRLVGDVVPRYVYWKTTSDGKNMSVECLSFDRDLEKFTNVEKDWFQHYFPDINCGWAYVARAINPTDKEKTILIPMKKGLYKDVMDVAEELGDPTDPVTGWDLVIMREKTGPQAFNVEYKLKQLKCKTRELDDDEKATIEKMPPIDELVPRQTPEEQKEFIERVFLNMEETETDEEAANDVEE
jgi:hypothetical protein